MTSRLVFSQLKRIATLRSAVIPQLTNHSVKRSLMTNTNNLWGNRVNAHKVSSLLGKQQGTYIYTHTERERYIFLLTNV